VGGLDRRVLGGVVCLSFLAWVNGILDQDGGLGNRKGTSHHSLLGSLVYLGILNSLELFFPFLLLMSPVDSERWSTVQGCIAWACSLYLLPTHQMESQTSQSKLVTALCWSPSWEGWRWQVGGKWGVGAFVNEGRVYGL
jgi:hypothetical protein